MAELRACTGCACDAGLSNTGADCTPIMTVALKAIAVAIFAADGTRNGIPFGTTLSQSYFDALVNQADKTKRWFPYPTFKNVEDLRDDNIYQTFADLTTAFVQQGARKFKSWITPLDGQGAATPQMIAIIQSGRCVNMGYYFVDGNNNLYGKISADGTQLEPIKIDEQSLAAKLVKGTNTEVTYIELTFNFNILEKDENLRMITCEELNGADLLELRGLVAACATVSEITTSRVKFTLKTSWGTPKTPITANGLVAGDFTVYNETQDENIPFTGSGGAFGEDPNGTYEITFNTAAQPAPGDEITITPTKAGYDFSCVSDEPVVVPTS